MIIGLFGILLITQTRVLSRTYEIAVNLGQVVFACYHLYVALFGDLEELNRIWQPPTEAEQCETSDEAVEGAWNASEYMGKMWRTFTGEY